MAANIQVPSQALVFLSNQGKTNKTGRRDQQAAFCHRLPELCCVGGLGFYLFSLFHILGTSPPDFSGEIGSCSWYNILLFPSSGGDDEEMTYQSELSFCFSTCPFSQHGCQTIINGSI